MIIFLNFLFSCVDYNGLRKLRVNEDNISNYLDFSNFYKTNFIYVFTTIIILMYIIVRVVGIIMILKLL